MLNDTLLKKHITLVLDALVKYENIRRTEINGIAWYITNYYAFAVPEKFDVFSPSIMGEFDASYIQKYFNNNCLLRQTGNAIVEGNKQIEEWESESGKKIYLDTKFTKLFPPQKIDYFGGEKSTDIICCKDKSNGDIVGVLCPMSEKWIEELMKNKEEKQWKS